jgi:hypothetical protein
LFVALMSISLFLMQTWRILSELIDPDTVLLLRAKICDPAREFAITHQNFGATVRSFRGANRNFRTGGSLSDLAARDGDSGVSFSFPVAATRDGDLDFRWQICV